MFHLLVLIWLSVAACPQVFSRDPGRNFLNETGSVVAVKAGGTLLPVGREELRADQNEVPFRLVNANRIPNPQQDECIFLLFHPQTLGL